MKVILFSLASVVLLSGCLDSRQEENIHAKIEAANFCETVEDCARVESKCPFGCHVYVHQNEVDNINELIANYDSNCVYGCISCSEVKCINNSCEPMCE